MRYPIPIARLSPLLDAVAQDLDGNWDCDEHMPPERPHELSYGRLILEMHLEDSDALAWLTFFVARRSLDCWSANTSDPALDNKLARLSAFFAGEIDSISTDLKQPVPSPLRDCRYSDMQSAADAVAWCASYAADRDPVAAVYCISAADCAYSHILTDHCFREWFVEVAVPRCFDKADLEAHDREAFRPYSPLKPSPRWSTSATPRCKS